MMMNSQKQNIAVLVSGGVDSSVALNLVKEEGHNITAFYLKIWLEDELSFLGDCPWEEDLEFVEKVCQQADIPLRIVNLQREYHDEVVSYTINEVRKGNTPNPDVKCNSLIKFGAFAKKLAEIEAELGYSFDRIVTGHYGNTVEYKEHTHLKLTPDQVKDQSYFLAGMSEEQLARAWFPLAPYTKEEVRELAREKFDLPNKWRKDSQGICFLGQISWKDFLKEHLGQKPGDFIELETGEVIGQHDGFWFYTIGQRNGLDLSGGPWYVASKDTEKNILYITKNYESTDKTRDSFVVQKPHWINSNQDLTEATQVKLRHGPKIYKCSVSRFEDQNNEHAVQIKLTERDQGIAPGQFAVFYTENGVCLGCGPMTMEII